MTIFQELQAKLKEENDKHGSDYFHPDVMKISSELDKYLLQEMAEVQMLLKRAE